MRVVSSLLVLVCASAAAEPSYDDVRTAAAEFQRGRKLLAADKLGEACTAFAKSQQLDPQAGTLYNLAGCYQRRGMLVSALAAYRDLAEHDRNPRRRDDAAAKAASIDQTLPRLQIDAPRGWHVSLNGVDATGKIGEPAPVDPGAYEVVGTAPGEPPFRTTVTVGADGKTTKIVVRGRHALDMVDPFGTPITEVHPVIATAPLPVDAARVRDRRYGIVAIAGGGVLLAGGLALVKSAFDRHHDAQALCTPAPCLTPDLQAQQDRMDSAAKSRGYAATVLLLGGAALGGYGGYLVWRSRHVHVDVAPQSVTVAGKF